MRAAEGLDVLRCEGDEGVGVQGVDAGSRGPVAGYVFFLDEGGEEGVVAEFPGGDMGFV